MPGPSYNDLNIFCLRAMLGVMAEGERESGLSITGTIVRADLIAPRNTDPCMVRYYLAMSDGKVLSTKKVHIAPGTVVVP